jgi:uncharacterized membrane protein YagU involved in acid resistance
MKLRNSMNEGQAPSAFSTIFWAGVIAGTLDGIAAALVFHTKLGLNTGEVMQFVASALFGEASFKGGYLTVLCGAALHYLLAFAISAFYFYAYPAISALRKWPAVFGLLYGLGVWLVINQLVLPLTRMSLPPFDLTGAVIAIVWHMVLVGLPIAFMVNIHYHASGQQRRTGFTRINRFKGGL